MKSITAVIILTLICSCAKQEREPGVNIFVPESRPKQTGKEIITEYLTAVVYEINEEKSDLNIVVGEATRPYKCKIKEGLFDFEEFQKLIENKSSEINCLCTPEYIQAIVVKDQWGQQCGALAFSQNHNSMGVFNRNGQLVSNYRFQIASYDKNAPIFSKAINTIDVFKESEKLIK